MLFLHCLKKTFTARIRNPRDGNVFTLSIHKGGGGPQSQVLSQVLWRGGTPVPAGGRCTPERIGVPPGWDRGTPPPDRTWKRALATRRAVRLLRSHRRTVLSLSVVTRDLMQWLKAWFFKIKLRIRSFCITRRNQGYTALCSPHRRSWVRVPNLHQCLWACLQVCGSKRLGCHADLYTRGESEDHTSQKAYKGSTLTLKPRADITRSPKRVSVAPRKGLVSSKKS